MAWRSRRAALLHRAAAAAASRSSALAHQPPSLQRLVTRNPLKQHANASPQHCDASRRARRRPRRRPRRAPLAQQDGPLRAQARQGRQVGRPDGGARRRLLVDRPRRADARAGQHVAAGRGDGQARQGVRLLLGRRARGAHGVRGALHVPRPARAHHERDHPQPGGQPGEAACAREGGRRARERGEGEKGGESRGRGAGAPRVCMRPTRARAPLRTGLRPSHLNTTTQHNNKT